MVLGEVQLFMLVNWSLKVNIVWNPTSFWTSWLKNLRHHLSNPKKRGLKGTRHAIENNMKCRRSKWEQVMSFCAGV